MRHEGVSQVTAAQVKTRAVMCSYPEALLHVRSHVALGLLQRRLLRRQLCRDHLQMRDEPRPVSQT